MGGQGITQFRGGVGLFAGTPPYVWLSNLFTNNGLTGISQFTCDGSSGRPAPPTFNTDAVGSAPQTCAGGVGPTTGSNIGAVNTIDPDYKQTQILRASLGVDRKLPWGFVGTLDGLYTKSYNSPFMTNLGLGDPVGTDFAGRVMYGTIAANGRATTTAHAEHLFCVCSTSATAARTSIQRIGGLTKRAGSVELSASTPTAAHTRKDFTSSVAGRTSSTGASLDRPVRRPYRSLGLRPAAPRQRRADLAGAVEGVRHRRLAHLRRAVGHQLRLHLPVAERGRGDDRRHQRRWPPGQRPDLHPEQRQRGHVRAVHRPGHQQPGTAHQPERHDHAGNAGAAFDEFISSLRASMPSAARS